MQQIKAEEEAAAASAEKRRDATSSLFIETDDEGAVPAGVASHVSRSVRFYLSRDVGDGDGSRSPRCCLSRDVGDSDRVKSFRHEPERLARQTVVTSGPYAGLLSAGKRQRDNVANPFAPPKKLHRQSDGQISS